MKHKRMSKAHILVKILLTLTDVAIGAPFEENGAVYVYHGSKDGINRNYKQVRVLLFPVCSCQNVCDCFSLCSRGTI